MTQTMVFIGVTTGSSSIMQIFPRWMAILGVDARLVGHDIALNAPAAEYRAIVEQIKRDPETAGALVTTHKIDLLRAARDLFDELDTYAQFTGEVSSISKRGERLWGHAKDPISSALALAAFVPAGHWASTGAEVLCLGGGGAAVAISTALANADDRPQQFTMVDISADRLEHARQIHRTLYSTMRFRYVLNGDAAENDRLMAELPPGSLVINATGMGKDRPGSPLTQAGVFPRGGLVWELNYRGERLFMQQAVTQQRAQGLTVEDGWTYFLHGWTQVIAEVFHLALTPALFAELDAAARL